MNRGHRNNNPLNIRESANWLGERSPSTDPEFEEFIDPVYGIRAAIRTLYTYHNKGVRTVRDIVSRWAPPTENNTENYIRLVSKRSGFEEDTKLAFNRAVYFRIVKEMALIESQYLLTTDEFIRAWELANIPD